MSVTSHNAHSAPVTSRSKMSTSKFPRNSVSGTTTYNRYSKLKSLIDDYQHATWTEKIWHLEHPFSWKCEVFTGASRLAMLNAISREIDCQYQASPPLWNGHPVGTDLGKVQDFTGDFEVQGTVAGTCDTFCMNLLLEKSGISVGNLGTYDMHVYSTSSFIYLIGVGSKCAYESKRRQRSGVGEAQGRFTIVGGKAFSMRLKWNGTPAFTTNRPYRCRGVVSICNGKLSIGASDDTIEAFNMDCEDDFGNVAVNEALDIQAEGERAELQPEGPGTFDLILSYDMLSKRSQQTMRELIIDAFHDGRLTSEHEDFLEMYFDRLGNTYNVLQSLGTNAHKKLFCNKVYNDPFVRAVTGRYAVASDRVVKAVLRLIDTARLNNLPQPKIRPEKGFSDGIAWVSGLFGKLFDYSNEHFPNFTAFVTWLTKSVRESLAMFINAGIGIIDTLFEKMVDYLVKAIVNCCNPFGLGDKIMQANPHTMRLISVFLFIGFLALTSFIGATAINMLVNWLDRKSVV